MGAVTDLIYILQSQWGWLVTMAVFLYEVGWPLWQTRLQSLTNPIEDKVDDLLETQVHEIQVIRAMSRELDGIDDERVDEYLVENGVEVDDFIIDSNDRQHSYSDD